MTTPEREKFEGFVMEWRLSPERDGEGYAFNETDIAWAAWQAALSAAPTRYVTVTTTEAGEAVAVSWQDDEHRILDVIWERGDAPTPPEFDSVRSENLADMLDDYAISGSHETDYPRIAHLMKEAATLIRSLQTPPEVEPVGYVERDKLEAFKERCSDYLIIFPPKLNTGNETVPVFTSPPSPKAEYDAEGNPLNLMAAAKDLEILLSRAVTVKMPGHESSRKYSNTMQYLRKFIGES